MRTSWIPHTFLVWLAAITLGLVPALATAEPVELAVQGRLTSVGGGPVADGTYPLGVALYDQSNGGNQLFTELFLAVPVQGGVFALALGTGNVKLDSAVFAGGKPRWLGVTVAGDAELPRQVLRPVPLAVQSLQANVAADLQCTGCVGPGQLAAGAVTGEKIAAGAVGANHVSFPWAASDAPGGAATFAVGANTAKQADKALLADQASFADEAATAKAALIAKDLQCSGCVDLGELSAATVAAFVSSEGGTVKGKLTVEGALELGTSPISGGRFAAIEVTKAACGAPNAGQVAMDTATKRLWLCDGITWLRISTCTGQCKAATTVACGQPISSDCGDIGACTGAGSYCATGSCTGGKCVGVGEDAAAPGASCKDILAKNPAAKTGTYWISPSGGAAYQVDCDMTTSGGGWVRVLKNAERYGNKQAAFKSLTDGSFTEMRAVHVSGYISCACSISDAGHPWQACNPVNGDVWSFELLNGGNYVVKQSIYTTLPPQCLKPATGAGDILCSVAWTVSKNADLTPTWHEPSNNTSLGDNCGTQVIDLWAR